jgi:hypothetical protein
LIVLKKPPVVTSDFVNSLRYPLRSLNGYLTFDSSR